MGQSAQAFMRWAKTSASAFNLSQGEAMRYGAVFSNLVAVFSKSTDEIFDNTKQLLEASAIVASGTGRTMEDVMTRLRSGLMGNTESIEDLGIYAQVGMIKTTKAFQMFANGKSWDQIDYQTQQQIRLFSILEQVQSRFGDTVMQNTISKQQQFLMVLKNVRLNLGQAFLPIYSAGLPALTALALKLQQVTSFIAQFMTALFGKAQGAIQSSADAVEAQAGAVDGLGDAYTKAGKAAKASVAGFDELNVLSKGGSDGTGAGAVGPTPIVTPGAGEAGDGALVEVGEKARALAEKVRGHFNTIIDASNKVKKTFSETIVSMKDVITQNKDLIISGLTGIVVAFGGFAILKSIPAIITAVKAAFAGIGAIVGGISLPILAAIAAVAALVAAFTYFYRTDENFKAFVDGTIEKLKEALIYLWNDILVPIGTYLVEGFITAWDATKEAMSNLWNNVLVPLGAFLVDVFVKAWEAVSKVMSWVNTNIFKPIGDFLVFMWKQVLVPLGKIIWDVLGIMFENVGKIISSFYNNVIKPLANFFVVNLKPAIDAVSAVLNFLWTKAIVPLAEVISVKLREALNKAKADFTALMKVVTWLWQNILKPLVTFIGGVFSTVFNNAFEMMGDVIDGATLAFKGLMDFITGVFTGDWDKAWNGVKDVFSGIFSSLYGIVKAPLNLIIDAINAVISGINSISFDIPSWVPGIGGKAFSINIPKMAKLAKGGITNGPMAAIIGDNVGGREVVSPLGDLMGMIQTAVSGAGNSDTNRLLTGILAATQEGKVLMVDKKTLAQVVSSSLSSNFRAAGQTTFAI
jgi:hypothetical protein